MSHRSAPFSSAAVVRAAALAAVVLLGGCTSINDWFTPEKPPLPGTRISVLTLQSSLEPDPRIQDVDVRLPRPEINAAWPQAGGRPSHAMGHLALGDAPRIVWRSSVGRGAEDYRRMLAPPVLADGLVFAMDSYSSVSAVDATSGRLAWRVRLRPLVEEDGGHGGGLAYADGVLFATTGFGEVIALVGQSGAELWRQRAGAPLRAAPTLSGDRLFVTTIENKTFALDVADGRRIWTHEALPESSGLMGAANPAVDGGIVVAPYSSGELYGLRTDNGRVIWAESLARAGASALFATFNDINARPVIDDDQVFALGSAGRMVAINARTGARIWDQPIGGNQMPWVAGDFVFVVTADAELLCLWKRNGRIRWVLPLQRYTDMKDREGPIQWSGPVLVGDRLIVVSSHGFAQAVSPYSGEVLGTLRLPDGTFISPIVAGETLYILTDAADLLALR